jgi:hypothetical protein
MLTCPKTNKLEALFVGKNKSMERKTKSMHAISLQKAIWRVGD